MTIMTNREFLDTYRISASPGHSLFYREAVYYVSTWLRRHHVEKPVDAARRYLNDPSFMVPLTGSTVEQLEDAVLSALGIIPDKKRIETKYRVEEAFHKEYFDYGIYNCHERLVTRKEAIAYISKRLASYGISDSIAWTKRALDNKAFMEKHRNISLRKLEHTIRQFIYRAPF
jgi:hypothetical protein